MSGDTTNYYSPPAVLSSEPAPLSRDIIKEIAMDVGKEVAHHIERMYPEAVAATASTFLLSVRNTTYNAIMAAIDVTDEDAIRERLKRNATHRREINRLWKLGEKAEAMRKAMETENGI